MIRLDTIHIESFNCVKEFEERYFTLNQKHNPQRQTDYTEYLLINDYRPLGVSRCALFKNAQMTGLQIKLSAKVLGADYYELINKNTIEQAIEGLSCDALQIDKKAFIDNARVLSCDSTLNIPVENVQEHIRSLNAVHNPKYRTEPYHAQGIVFKDKRKTHKERFIFYDKYAELTSSRKATDKKLLSMLNIDAFKGILRNEFNLRGFEELQKYLKIGKDRKLTDALESDAHPNLSFFSGLIPELTVDVITQSHKDYKDAVYYQKILEQFNGDFNRAKDFIRSFYEYYPANEIKKLSKVFNNEIAINESTHIRGLQEAMRLASV